MLAVFGLVLGMPTSPALPPAHEAGPEERVPTLGAAPDFALTSQHGKQVRLEDFCSKVVAVSFIYASCPDVCLLFSDKLACVHDALRPDFGSKVAFLSITVDPEPDTPKVLKEHPDLLDADLAGWSFLTETPATAREVAQRYGLAVAKGAAGPGGPDSQPGLDLRLYPGAQRREAGGSRMTKTVP